MRVWRIETDYTEESLRLETRSEELKEKKKSEKKKKTRKKENIQASY